MASSKEFERLSIPSSLGSGFCPSSPTTAQPPFTASSTASSSTPLHPNPHPNGPSSASASDSGHSGSIADHLTVLARTVSTHSRRNSVLSNRSISSVLSHVSFQNVRFDPDPIKDISFWGGLALLISNMTGPGIVTLPLVAQSAGWLPTLLGFLLVGFLSTLSSLFICEAMTEVPGNEYFQSNVEFSNLVLCFFGRRYHLLVQIICFLAMQTTNIASIAVSAQLFDNLIIQIFHRTCGIQIYPSPAFVCVTEQLSSASPFTGIMIMTAGVLLSFAMILPLGLLKLSENIWVQLASFALIILIVLQWIVTFITHGLDTSLVPAVGTDISQTFGTILFNYAFVTTVPSWANAKQPNVSIHKTVNWAVGITTTMYVAVAILGGMAFQIPSNSSLIQAISSSPDVTVLSQITGYTFPIAALITSIPINIIVIRYNLIQSGACNMVWANVFAGLLPWLVAIPCMTGSGLTTVINWSSLFLVSTANFIIPFILYIYSKKHREKLNKLPIIEMEQQARLSREVSRSSFSGNSRRNTSVSGSIRRRLTGSSFHLRSQSYTDLVIGPPTAIAAASVIPVAVGIGSGSLIHHSISEENLPGELSRHGSHRRSQTHQPSTLGPNSASDLGEPVIGPYFSFSRDGELFERESSAPNSAEPSDWRIQGSTSTASHRPSGVSTVILHDPVTEMAQRKLPIPRRVSHKDKLLSMLSDKHKRAMEQAKIQEQQNEKPVPPMILLSQSTAPEPDDDDGLDAIMDAGMYSQNNESYESEAYSEKSAGAQTKDIAEANTNLSAAIKKLNRQSSAVVPALNQNRSTLTLPPLSPPLRINTPMQEERFEHALEPSPTFSPPRSPASPQKSAMRRSSSTSPGRSSPRGSHETATKPSISLSLTPEMAVMDSSRLGPGSGAAGGPGFNLQLSPSTPDSAASMSSLERRVSFSDERRLDLSTPELEHRFSDETKHVVKTAVATLTGGSPSRPGYSPSQSRNSDVKSQEWMMTLLEDHQETEEGEQGNDQEVADEEQDSMGPEIRISGVDLERGRLSECVSQRNDARRDSLGRMAAAFVSQPGSFSIRTAPLNLSRSPGRCDPSIPEINVHHESDQQLEQGGEARMFPPGLALSPSAPPAFQLSQPPSGRNHGRTVSASGTLQDRSSRAQRHTARSQSTQSLRDKVGQQNQLAVPESANSLSIHLTPPSPSQVYRGTFEASSPRSAVEPGKETVGLPASSAPPSPQKSPMLQRRTSVGGRNIRLSGSGKTLAAPFQSGNNYSIPGFGSSHSPASPVNSSHQHPPPSPGYSIYADQQGPLSAQGFGSSWFNRRRHSRDPTRTSGGMLPSPSPGAGGDMPPHSADTSSIPPSPHPSMLEAGGVGRRSSPIGHYYQQQEPMTPKTAALVAAADAAAEAADIAEFERREHQLHESQFYLPQYSLEGEGGCVGALAGFDPMWSLRAIPRWVPVSSLKIAWGSLALLAVAIIATIVYDFVQLGLGNNVMSGS